MFSDKIKLLPISEINLNIVDGLGNTKNEEITYFYDRRFNDIKILKCKNTYRKVSITKFQYKFNISFCNFLSYKKCP